MNDDVNWPLKRAAPTALSYHFYDEHEENEDFIRRSGTRVGLHPTNFPGKFVNFGIYQVTKIL